MMLSGMCAVRDAAATYLARGADARRVTGLWDHVSCAVCQEVKNVTPPRNVITQSGDVALAVGSGLGCHLALSTVM